MKFLILKKRDNTVEVSSERGEILGSLVENEDGFYYFWPNDNSCGWSADLLTSLGTLVEDFNNPWRDKKTPKKTESFLGKISKMFGISKST